MILYKSRKINTNNILLKSADLPGSACQNTFALLISRISFVILTISQSLTVVSHILYLISGGSLKGGLSCPPRNPAKSRFKLLCHTYLLTLLTYLLTLLTYLLTYGIYIENKIKRGDAVTSLWDNSDSYVLRHWENTAKQKK